MENMVFICYGSSFWQHGHMLFTSTLMSSLGQFKHSLDTICTIIWVASWKISSIWYLSTVDHCNFHLEINYISNFHSPFTVSVSLNFMYYIIVLLKFPLPGILFFICTIIPITFQFFPWMWQCIIIRHQTFHKASQHISYACLWFLRLKCPRELNIKHLIIISAGFTCPGINYLFSLQASCVHQNLNQYVLRHH